MESGEGKEIRLHDFKPGQDCFRDEVLSGLLKPQKELPCKYFYDEHGSELFDCICELDEYYLTRTEKAIMDTYIDEMVELLGVGILIIEYGSGNSTKTRVLLDNLRQPAAYVPVDISREQLLLASKELRSRYSGLRILPVCDDYTGCFELPGLEPPGNRTVVYFPGSSIGNFDPIPSRHFLEHIADVCGSGGGLLIGVDLKKDRDIIHRAYNDSKGVTAAFNLNLLERINRELGCDFQLDWFEHYAFYNPEESRIEMHLVSLRDQAVKLDNVTIPFTKGESIWTENSYKYSIEEFERMANAAGFRVQRVWTDERQWFSVQYLVNMK